MWCAGDLHAGHGRARAGSAGGLLSKDETEASTPQPVSFLAYPLRDGYVVNWLVAGPVVSTGPIAWDDGPGIDGEPVERGPLGTGGYQIDGQAGTWVYHACPEDQAVDHSGSFPPGSQARSWAYAELISESARAVTVELTATGSAGLWLNGTPALRIEGGTGRARVHLDRGVTRTMVRFEAIGIGETAHTAALRIEADGAHVQIPTLIEDVGRREAFEQLTAVTYLERDVFEGGSPIVLRWPPGERAFCMAHARLHGADDAIFALADVVGEPGDATELGYALQLPPGPMHVTLMPSPDEVYLRNTRVAHHLPLWSMGRQRYAATPADGDLSTRRGEALLAIAEYAHSVYGQIARMALGAWNDVDMSVITRACDQPNEAVLLALVGMLHRVGSGSQPDNDLAGPAQEQDSLEDGQAERAKSAMQAAERAILGYQEWLAPGSESSRITRHAAEVLAGQRYPGLTFADGQPGAWHRANGERLALAWMTEFASQGSALPGAAEVIEQEAAALAYLADLAESPSVYELAAVCLDKLLFLLAVHSRQGVLGAASPSALASFVKSGLLQPTAPITRLLWGTGIYNHHQAGALSLACATNYEPPPILESIAHDVPTGMWSRERHAPTGAETTTIVTFKTPEYVLSSLADVAPGSTGYGESVWRATLSPEAIVFVNQPGSSSESNCRLPGFWSGNARLPRVGQRRDALIAMHRVEETGRLPFTHAHFPCATFDEYVLREGWAFARDGEGYVALTSSAGIVLTDEGRYALRELRSFGPTQTWLVQMGRAALDGSFAAFQAKVLASPYECSTELTRWTTIRGDDLDLAWDGPLLVNGRSQALEDGSHIENAYVTADLPCASIDIRLGDDLLRLDFMTP